LCSYVNLESVLTERQSSSSSSGVDELGYSSPKRIGSPHNAVAPLREHLPIAWGFDRTVEQANILEKGCWLSKWTVDSKGTINPLIVLVPGQKSLAFRNIAISAKNVLHVAKCTDLDSVSN
jgi:hypothetical protein